MATERTRQAVPPQTFSVSGLSANTGYTPLPNGTFAASGAIPTGQSVNNAGMFPGWGILAVPPDARQLNIHMAMTVSWSATTPLLIVYPLIYPFTALSSAGNIQCTGGYGAGLALPAAGPSQVSYILPICPASAPALVTANTGSALAGAHYLLPIITAAAWAAGSVDILIEWL